MFNLRFTFALLMGIITMQSAQAQSQLTQKQIEKENYKEVPGFSEFQNDSLKPDVFPKYPNGQKGLIKDVSKNIKYPPSARKKEYREECL